MQLGKLTNVNGRFARHVVLTANVPDEPMSTGYPLSYPPTKDAGFHDLSENPVVSRYWVIVERVKFNAGGVTFRRFSDIGRAIWDGISDLESMFLVPRLMSMAPR